MIVHILAKKTAAATSFLCDDTAPRQKESVHDPRHFGFFGLTISAMLMLLLLSACATKGLNFPGSLEYIRYTQTPPAAPDSTPAEFLPPEPGSSEEHQIPSAEQMIAILESLPPPSSHLHRANPGDGIDVASAAATLVESTRITTQARNGSSYPHDCMGFVAAAYTLSGWDLTLSIKNLFAQAEQLGLTHYSEYPSPGDIIFFDNSYDKNRNGHRDDPLTHVAIVETVNEEGTITMIHLGGAGLPVTRKLMNLRDPDRTRNDEGAVINQHLRATSQRDGGPTLTSQLFTGFASLWAISPSEYDEL